MVLLNPVAESLMKRTLAEEAARQAQMARAQRAYDGDFPKPLKVKPGQPDDNVTVNVIAPVVDMGVHFLFGAPPAVTISEPDIDDADVTPGDVSDEEPDAMPIPPPPIPAPTSDGTLPALGLPTAPAPTRPAKPKPPTVVEQAQAWLDDCLAANNWEVFLLDFGTNGGIHGTPYSRIYTSDMLPNPDEPARPFPRLRALDPQTMRIMWDARDIDKVKLYVWQYNAGMDEKSKLPRIERQLIERIPGTAENVEEGTVATPDKWRITDQHATTSDAQWVTDSTTEWEKPWPPIQHCKNLPAPNCVYGKADVQDTMIQANKQLNLSLSNSQRIERFYGSPRVWLKGNKGEPVTWQDTGAGVILDLPNPASEIGMIEPQGDMGQAMERRKELYSYILQEAGTPTIVLGKVDDTMKTDPSGVSLKIRLIPMTAKIEAKRKTYGPMLIELIKHLLELGGWPVGFEVSLEWKEHLPVDPMEERQVLAADRAMGIVSLETIANKLDYDWESEKQKLDQEKAEGAQRQVTAMQNMMAQRSAVVGVPNQPGQPPNPQQLAARQDTVPTPVPAGGKGIGQ